jgi:hypothetical protein
MEKMLVLMCFFVREELIENSRGTFVASRCQAHDAIGALGVEELVLVHMTSHAHLHRRVGLI